MDERLSWTDGAGQGERAQGSAVADDFSGRKNNPGRFDKSSSSHH